MADASALVERMLCGRRERVVVSESNNTRTLVRNSSFSAIAPGDGNAAGTSLAPVSGNADENNSRGALLIRDNGTNYIEAVNDLLLAFERLVADASALVERMLSGRRERVVVSESSNTRTPVRNSSFSAIAPGDGNAAGTSFAPVSGNADENNSRGALLNRDNGTNDIEPIDDSLLALERRVADASALVERMLRGRREGEQFGREIERMEQMIRERRERERREREEREIQEVEEQEQEAISLCSPMAL